MRTLTLVTVVVCFWSCSKQKSAADLVEELCEEVCGEVSPCRCADSELALRYAMVTSEHGQAGWEAFSEQYWCPSQIDSGCDDEVRCWSTCQTGVGMTRTVATFEDGRMIALGSEFAPPVEPSFDLAMRRAVEVSAVVAWELDSPLESHTTTFNEHLEPVLAESDWDNDGTVDERRRITRNASGGITRLEEDLDGDGSVDYAFDFDPPCLERYEFCQVPSELSELASGLVERVCSLACADVTPCYCSEASDLLTCAMAAFEDGAAVWNDYCAFQCPKYLDSCQCIGDQCTLSCSGGEYLFEASFTTGRLERLDRQSQSNRWSETIRCDPSSRVFETTYRDPETTETRTVRTTHNEHWFVVMAEEDGDGDGRIDRRTTNTTDDAGRLITIEVDSDGDGAVDDVATFDPPCDPPYLVCSTDRSHWDRSP